MNDTTPAPDVAVDEGSADTPPESNNVSTAGLNEEPEQRNSHEKDESLPNESNGSSGGQPKPNIDPPCSGQTDDSQSDAGDLPPSDYHVVLRLLHYMQTPDDNQLWWAEKPHPLFRHFETSTTVLEGVLRMFRTNPATFSRQQIILFLAEVIHKAPLSDWVRLDAISGLWTSRDESEFDASFIIGPGGLGIVLTYLKYTYDILDRDLADCRKDASLSEVWTFYVALPTVICNLLTRFRAKHAHERHLWDPDGFRELSTLLAKYDQRLTVAKANHRMHLILKKIDLETMTPAQVQFDLTSAFHDSSNPKMMYADVVVGGEFGLHGYYKDLVVYILDVMPLSEPHHREFYQLFSKASHSLARKVVNYFKDGRHKSTKPSNNSNKNSKEEQGPRTRSKCNAKTGKWRIPTNENTDTDSSDDMTNTASLESQWYCDVEENQPDIKF
ncbi:uncharacterized protein EV420DRAFT_1569383 [Desarmillaria tabescens]|uniref:Uncharacterized protein n=1 Tax=Armillaria tabescens TaxID=1929756 RepID=A0AA39JQE8_ARMTA|nr:uncharacterized protein EV420DRAFT_1569383 [Desarmillaria tabescens]KAK0447010.1 hypothetical protein EV420DRAFT_1569383 [Desarmillaria tabescens]